jgi:hypothetical protein
MRRLQLAYTNLVFQLLVLLRGGYFNYANYVNELQLRLLLYKPHAGRLTEEESSNGAPGGADAAFPIHPPGGAKAPIVVFIMPVPVPESKHQRLRRLAGASSC